MIQIKKDVFRHPFFFILKIENLSFEKYFYDEQNRDEKDKHKQNLVIIFVKSFMQHCIFSISINHCDNKSNKKSDSK